MNGRASTDPGAKWINTGVANENGKPLIIQSLAEPNHELQAYIMQSYDSAAPGQTPSSFTYIPTPAPTNVRGTVVDVAGAVSTSAGRFGAIAVAGASLPSPLSPGLGTAAYVATVTGVVADAVQQLAQPNSAQYVFNGTTAIFNSVVSSKLPVMSPVLNEFINQVNKSEAATEVQNQMSEAIKRIIDGESQ